MEGERTNDYSSETAYECDEPERFLTHPFSPVGLCQGLVETHRHEAHQAGHEHPKQEVCSSQEPDQGHGNSLLCRILAPSSFVAARPNQLRPLRYNRYMRFLDLVATR